MKKVLLAALLVSSVNAYADVLECSGTLEIQYKGKHLIERNKSVTVNDEDKTFTVTFIDNVGKKQVLQSPILGGNSTVSEEASVSDAVDTTATYKRVYGAIETYYNVTVKNNDDNGDFISLTAANCK